MNQSVKKFTELNINSEILSKLNENNFYEMTSVQQNTIPVFLSNKDVIVQSQTGSGKTLSYLIPILSNISLESKNIQSLIIVPTRELGNQIKDVISMFNVNSEVFIGGSDIEEDYKKLETSICIGTPGRLLEILQNKRKEFLKVKYLILDESDKLLDQGFESKLLSIIKFLPKSRITSLFSATVNEAVNRLSIHFLNNPVFIKITENIPDKLDLKYIAISPSLKYNLLLKIIFSNKRSIVFFSTCNQVNFFYELTKTYIKSNDINIETHKIHGKMNQSDRNITYDEYNKTDGILFCTDVAARGIDFKNINVVVHFDIPKDYANIVHRSGRTARNGLSGESIIFIMNNELPYIDYLKLKGITVKNYENVNLDNIIDFNIYKNTFILELAVKAFVSYIRSYKEHIIDYILNLKELDFDGLAELFLLEKIPSMKELKKIKFSKFERPENSNEKQNEKRKRDNCEFKNKKVKSLSKESNMPVNYKISCGIKNKKSNLLLRTRTCQQVIK